MGDPTERLEHYDGLIFKTATMLDPFVERMDLDDIQQVLRIKAWKALRAYRPERARGMPRDRYVFMCLRDQAKDLASRKKRRESYIDDQTPPEDDMAESTNGAARRGFGTGTLSMGFLGRHLSVDHDSTFHDVEDEFIAPNTLTVLERQIVVRLYLDYRQTEVAAELGLGKHEMERAMRSIREKLADWRPSAPPAASSSNAADEPTSRLQSELRR